MRLPLLRRTDRILRRHRRRDRLFASRRRRLLGEVRPRRPLEFREDDARLVRERARRRQGDDALERLVRDALRTPLDVRERRRGARAAVQDAREAGAHVPDGRAVDGPLDEDERQRAADDAGARVDAVADGGELVGAKEGGAARGGFEGGGAGAREEGACVAGAQFLEGGADDGGWGREDGFFRHSGRGRAGRLYRSGAHCLQIARDWV